MGVSREEILSVINKWNKDGETLANYTLRHGWLKADILKLKRCIKENNLQNVAITDTCIYGLENGNIPFCTGRENLGIADNFQ